MRPTTRITKIQSTNTTTGEHQDFNVHTTTPTHTRLTHAGGGFTTMGYAAHARLATADLSLPAYKLFHHMCATQSRREHGLILMKSQAQLATDAGISKAAASRAIRQLKDLGIIYEDSGNLRLNPLFVFNGTGEKQAAIAEEIPPETPNPFTP